MVAPPGVSDEVIVKMCTSATQSNQAYVWLLAFSAFSESSKLEGKAELRQSFSAENACRNVALGNAKLFLCWLFGLCKF